MATTCQYTPRRRPPAWALVVAIVVTLNGGRGALVVAGGITPNNACAAAKNRAAVKAFACIAGAQRKILFGGQGDLAYCSDKMMAAFTKAEAKGGCPSIGDVTAVTQRIIDAENDLLAALQAGFASADAAKKCIAAKNKIAVKASKCTAAMMNKALKGMCSIASPCSKVCNISNAFANAEAKGGCLTTGDVSVLTDYAQDPATNLAGADLRDMYLRFAPLRRANLAGANLANAVLSGTDLSQANLSGAILTNASLESASMSLTNLQFANLTGANLTYAQPYLADFTGADLSGADLTAINGVLAGCPAAVTPPWICRDNALFGPTVHLLGAYLPGVDASGADLTGALLNNSYLENANLTNVIGAGAQFGGARLSGADLAGASIDTTSDALWYVHAINLANCPSTLPPSWRCVKNALVGTSAILDGADLSGADMTGVQMVNVSLHNVDLTNVTWSHTGCPDGSTSSTNGSSPESCCGYYANTIPLSCSP